MSKRLPLLYAASSMLPEWRPGDERAFTHLLFLYGGYVPSRRKDALSGFKYAQDGILHCFRTQKHMRYHFYTLIAVLLSGLLLNLDSRDMLVLLFAITLVIVAEMFNTVVEAVVDMITENYNPAA